jgi:hypothetical protein
MIDVDHRDKIAFTIRNISKPEVADILAALLTDNDTIFHKTIEQLDPRVAEKEHFLIHIGYFDPYSGER